MGEVAVSAAGEGFLIRNLALAIAFVVGPLPEGEVNNLLLSRYRHPMTYEEAIQQFGLPSTPEHRPAIRVALEAELKLEENEEGDHDLIKCLAAQLLSIGKVDDSLLIWRAKDTNFDLMCGLDIQFLCGAGIEETKRFLTQTHSQESRDALEYLEECIVAGDFEDWTPTKSIQQYRHYFQLDSELPPES